MKHDYAVDAETHEKVVDALLIATSKLDAAERDVMFLEHRGRLAAYEQVLSYLFERDQETSK